MENINLIPYISEAFVSKKFGYTESKIETADGVKKQLILEGEFQEAEKPNKNKRVYSLSLLTRETNKLRNFIEERNGLPMGMDHPLPGETEKDLILTQRKGLENSCALCIILEMNGRVVYGKSRVLEGDYGTGDKLATLVKHGFKPAVSSRGLGGKPVYNPMDSFVYVPEDYNMITYDYVTDPSTHNAILNKYMEEEYFNFQQQNKYHRKLWDVMIELRDNKLKK